MDGEAIAGGIFVICIVIGIIAYIGDFIATRRQALERVNFLEKNNNELSAKYYQLSQKYQELENAIQSAQIIIQKAKEKSSFIVKEAESKATSLIKKAEGHAAFIVKISEDKVNAIPYLADIYADFVKARASAIEDYLRTKKNPAFTAAENISLLKNDLAREAKARKIAEYNLTVKSYKEKLSDFESHNDTNDKYDPRYCLSIHFSADFFYDCIVISHAPFSFRNSPSCFWSRRYS